MRVRDVKCFFQVICPNSQKLDYYIYVYVGGVCNMLFLSSSVLVFLCNRVEFINYGYFFKKKYVANSEKKNFYSR